MRTNKAAYDGPDVATRTGPFVKYIGRGGTYVIALKGGKNSGKHSQAVRDNRDLFAEVTHLMHLVDGPTYQWCRDQAKGTLYLPRDILAKLIYGTLMRFEMVDGTYKIGARMVATDIQKMLDGISQAVGAILVRTQAGWAALTPGTDNQILAMDAVSKLPIWRNETASAPEAQAALDQISALSGAVLYRTDDGWRGVTPGNAGQFLRIDPATGALAWASVVLNAVEFSTSLDGISDKPGAIIMRTAEKWTTVDPGEKGQFYVIDPVSGLPAWKTVDLGTVAANAALDTISTDVGALVIRGDAGWQGVPPGEDGYVLTSNGQGTIPHWSAPTGGQGGATVERLAAQVVNVGGAQIETMWQRTLAAGDVVNGKSVYRIKAVFAVISNAPSAGIDIHINDTDMGNLIGNNAQTGWVFVLDCLLTQYQDSVNYDVAERVMTNSKTLAASFEYVGNTSLLHGQEAVIKVEARGYSALAANCIRLETLTFELLG